MHTPATIQKGQTFSYETSGKKAFSRVEKIEDGKAQLSFRTADQEKWTTGVSTIKLAAYTNFLNSCGAILLDPNEKQEVISGKPEVSHKKDDKPASEGPSIRDLCLDTLKTDEYQATSKIAAAIGKPTAAVNSSLSAMARKGLVESIQGDGCISWRKKA